MKSHQLAVLLLLVAACAAPPPELAATSLDFGTVEPSKLHRGTLRVTNGGTSAAELLRIDRKSGPESVSIVPSKPGLAPGETSTWSVNFRPDALGRVEARFAAVFDVGTVTFTVRALVAPPCEAEPFDLGDARVGASSSRRMRFSNPLSEPAALTISAPPGPFSSEATGTLRLGAGEDREVVLHFAPSTAGVIEAPWRVATRTDCTPAPLTLRGRALDAPLAFVPGRLHFGVVAVGAEAVRTVDLENRTRSSVQLSRASLDAAGFTLLTPLPLEVPAEGKVALSVQARPGSVAEQFATLTVFTDALGTTTVTLPLLVNRSAPCLTRSTPRLDFPSVEVACRTPGEPVTLTNDCPHPVRLAPPQLSADFGLVSTPGSSALAPRSSQALSVLFFPRTHGDRPGTLRLEADVLDGTESLDVALSGTATPASLLEETLDLPERPADLDVLLVIDDSPRMLPYQDTLELNLRFLARYFTANQLDWRVGVMSTSTAPGVVGRLRRTSTGESWLDNPTSTLLAAHGAVRGESTGRSSCLEALQAAAASPVRDEPGELGAFLRPATPLHVICITNGRDELEGPVTEVLATLARKLPARRLVTVIARFASFEGATGCDGAVDHGPLRALALSEPSGSIEEFCTPNWSIDRIGRPTDHGYRVHFALRGVPSLMRGPIRVFIDGFEWPSTDPNVESRIWLWDSAPNAVVFEPLYAPAPGSRLTVQYTPDCPD